jgi:hypothetical protein
MAGSGPAYRSVRSASGASARGAPGAIRLSYLKPAGRAQRGRLCAVSFRNRPMWTPFALARARPRPDQFTLTARTADAVHGIPPAAADGGDAAPDLGVQLSPLIAPAHADAVLIEVNSPGNQFGLTSNEIRPTMAHDSTASSWKIRIPQPAHPDQRQQPLPWHRPKSSDEDPDAPRE